MNKRRQHNHEQTTQDRLGEPPSGLISEAIRFPENVRTLLWRAGAYMIANIRNDMEIPIQGDLVSRLAKLITRWPFLLALWLLVILQAIAMMVILLQRTDSQDF